MKQTALEEKHLPRELPVGVLALVVPLPADAPELFSVIAQNRQHINEFINITCRINTLQNTEEYIRNINRDYRKKQKIAWLIRKQRKIIGMFHLSQISWHHGNVEIGYWLAADSTGNGYISACLQKVEHLLFEIGFERLVLGIDPENIASRKIAAKNRYNLEGAARHARFSLSRQQYRDILYYSKLRPGNLL